MSQENLGVVKGIYRAFEDGDVQAVFARFDPSVEWLAAENSPAARSRPCRGVDEVRDGVFKLIAEEFPGLAMSVNEWLDAGERIVVLGIYAGERKVTGKRFRAQFAHIWTVAAGKVVRFQQYTDTHQLAETAK